MIFWFIGIILLLVAAYIFLDREIYFYEGTHLGRRVQAWLYDRWAKKYDAGKQASQEKDAEMLASPLLSALAATPNPLVLDVATGTGRLPLALLREPAFAGRVIALDISLGMLEQAAEKLAAYRDGVRLLRQSDWPLPFQGESFDMVCCLEALEVMPEMETPLAELYRVLRPGGFLVTSRGTEASGRRARVMSPGKFTALLHSKGFVEVEIMPWWKLFDRVLAHKPGQLIPTGFRSFTDVFICPACKQSQIAQVGKELLHCTACNAEVKVNAWGIVLN